MDITTTTAVAAVETATNSIAKLQLELLRMTYRDSLDVAGAYLTAKDAAILAVSESAHVLTGIENLRVRRALSDQVDALQTALVNIDIARTVLLNS